MKLLVARWQKIGVSLALSLSALGCTLDVKTKGEGSSSLPAVGIGFSTNSVTLNEGGSQTVSLQTSQTLTQGRIVYFNFSGPAARFLNLPSQITIVSGSSSAPLDLQLNADTIHQGSQTLIVQLGGAGWQSMPGFGALTITLGDDDPIPQVSISDASANENNGPLGLVVSLDRASSQNVTFDFATQDGTALSGSDYVAVLSGRATIAAGALAVTIQVPLTADSNYEASEQFQVNLTNITNATGLDTLADATITNDDSQPSVSFALLTSNLSEGAASPQGVSLQLSATSYQEITVPVNFGGSAIGGGVDYSLVGSAVVTIPAGATGATLGINSVPDTIDENDESIVLSLGAPINASIGANPTHIVTLLDDDAPPQVEFTLASWSVSEADGSTSLAITLSSASGRDVVVPINVGAGSTASEGPLADFSRSVTSLTISAGSQSASLPINIMEDSAYEAPDEFVDFVIGTSAQATPGSVTLARLTITNNDLGTFSITGVSGGTDLTSDAYLGDGLVPTISWSASVLATSYDVTIYQDNGSTIACATQNSVSTSLVSGCSLSAGVYYRLSVVAKNGGDTRSATNSLYRFLVLPTLSWSSASQSVGEGAGSLSLIAQLNQPIEENVTFSFNLGGSATLGSDYSISGGASPVTIAQGQSAITITVGITDDATADPGEDMTFTLSSVSLARVGTPSTHTVTIVDNEMISLSVAAIYPNNSNWNHYVKNANGGTSDYDQPDVSCDGTETGGYQACIHGGEKRKVVVTGYTSCSGLSAQDSLGAFVWVCRSPGLGQSVEFVSAHLRLGKGLADLLDAGTGPDYAQWRANSVSVYSGATLIGTSTSTVWWTNPVVVAPSNSAAPIIVLDGTDNDGAGPDQAYAEGTIFVVPSSRNTNGYNLNLDRLGWVVAKGAVATFAGTAAGCVWATGENKDGGYEENCMVAAGSQKFLWIEGEINGRTSNMLDMGVLLTNVRFSRVNNFTQVNGDDTGVGLANSHNLKLTGIKASNYGGYANIYLEGATWNHFIDVQVARATHGINLNSGSHFNTFVNVRAYNAADSTNNINFDSSTDNTFVKVLSASSGNAGFHVKNNSPRTTLSHYFSANESDESIYLGSPNATLNQIVVVNSGDNWGAIYVDTANHLLSQIVATNGHDHGLDFNGVSNSRFTNNVLVGNAALGNCFVSGGTNPGLTSACANQGTSDANWVVGAGVSLANSFVGKVTSDDSSNLNDASGANAFSTFGIDWLNFENLFRMWSKDGSTFPNLDQTDVCNAGTCRIWDWRLKSSDTVIRNRSGNATSSNEAFVAGATCPSAVHGNRAITDQNISPRTFLVNAEEIVGDGVGNDNGLCESSEACIYSPNFGYYQGEGDYLSQGSCTFVNGTVTGVTMYSYPTNGAP